MVEIIVSYNNKRVIGKDNVIPWYCPEDLEHFNKITFGQNVIMGYNTWSSMSEFPLQGRNNFILTKKISYRKQGSYGEFFYSNMEDAIDFCNDIKCRTYVMGGQETYKYCLENKLCKTVIATEIDSDEEGDKFFPELSKDWKQVSKTKVTEKVNIVIFKR